MERDFLVILFAALLCSTLCSVLGVYLNMRRQSMLIDVLSHSAMPGIVVSYIIFAGYSAIGVSVGAAVCSFLSVLGIEKLTYAQKRIKRDSAMAVIFTSMFALGVLLIAFFADRTHIDIQCALFGDLLFSPFWGDHRVLGLFVPKVLARLLVVFLMVFVVLRLFHWKIIAASFWGEASSLMGVSEKQIRYVLAFLVSLVVMVSFELVGIVMVIALFSIPPAFGRLVVKSWQKMFVFSVLFGWVTTIMGLLVGWSFSLNLGGAIATAQFLCFMAAFVLLHFKQRYLVAGVSDGG